MRDPALPVAGIIDGLVLMVPPPTKLLVGEQLLAGGIGRARLREPVALRARDHRTRARRVRPKAEIRRIGVEPGEFLAALNVGLQVGERGERRRAGEAETVHRINVGRPHCRLRRAPVHGVEATGAGPVRQRQVIVERNEVDGRRSVELVEMRPLPIRAGMLDPHPVGPVGGIGDEVVQAGRIARQPGTVEDRTHVRGELRQPGHEWIVPARAAISGERAGLGPGRPAQRLEPAQLRADEEKVDATRHDAEVGVMRDHAAVGVVGRSASVGDGQVRRVARKLRQRRRPEEAGDGVAGGLRDVGALVADAPAPGIARRIHQQERIEDDAQPSRAEVADAADDRSIRRRTAVDEAAAGLRERDKAGRRLRQAGAAPGIVGPRAVRDHLRRAADERGRRIDRALRCIGRVAEPGADERDRLTCGIGRLQIVDGDRIVGSRPARRGGEVLHDGRGLGDLLRAMRDRVVDPLAGGRQQVDAERIGHASRFPAA